VSMLVAQMEKQGWVQRESDSADARVKRLSLTEAGMAVARQTLQVQAEVVSAMVASASEADMEVVTRVMDRASEALEAMRIARA